MPQSQLTDQLKEKPTYRVWCLYSSFVHGLGIGRGAGGSFADQPVIIIQSKIHSSFYILKVCRLTVHIVLFSALV
jgi:hypothetical protein